MRPPECAVCGADDAAGGFGLVRCVSTPEDLAWRERAEREGLVGHPPDTGWFCGEHVGAARDLAASLTRREVVAAVRASGASRDAAAPETPNQPGTARLPAAGSIAGGAMGALYRALIDELPALAAGAGIEPARLQRSTSREWHPMDRTMPPDCPFVDTTVDRGEEDGAELQLSFEMPHWGPDEPTRTFMTLSLTGAGESDFRVSAWSPASGAPDALEDASLRGAVPPEIAMFVEVAKRS